MFVSADTTCVKRSDSIVFMKVFHSFSAENVAPHGSDAIFKLVNVSYAPPNCTDPLVKGEGLFCSFLMKMQSCRFYLVV